MRPDPGPGAAGAPRGLNKPNLADLAPRIVSAIVLVAIAIGTAIAGGLAFALVWWAAALAIHWEWQRLVGSGRDAARLIVGALAIILAAIAVPYGFGAWSLLLLVAGAMATGWFGQDRRFVSGAGVLYAGLLPLSLGLLRNSERQALEAVFWLFAVVWGTDIMAYFGGRLIGGPKLWTRVSPSKTWSGFCIGVGSGAVAGFLVSSVWATVWAILPLGLAIGALSQAGDLFESALKRHYGAKDSSSLIPGHGGVMDRLDGFLVASVAAALLGLLRGGPTDAAAGLLQW